MTTQVSKKKLDLIFFVFLDWLEYSVLLAHKPTILVIIKLCFASIIDIISVKQNIASPAPAKDNRKASKLA